MTRFLAIVSAAAMLAAGAQAQCLGAPTGSTIVGPGFVKWNSTAGYGSTFVFQDEGITSPPIALTAFPSFPMAGAVGNLDQLWVNSNGEVYLTDSTLALTQPVGGALYGVGDLAEMRGTAVGASARVVALGGDNLASAVAGAAWDIRVDQTVPGEVRIDWIDMARLTYTSTDRFSFAMTLYASGAVRFDYGATLPTVGRYVGISIGNGVGSTSSPSRDLTGSADSGTEGLLYESAASDLTNKQILIQPNGLGGYVALVACAPAFNRSYGTGCYSYSAAAESFYEEWASTALSGAALNGNVMLLVPTANGYQVNWIPGVAAATFVAPTGAATLLATTDDGAQTITPSLPVPSPFGPAAQITISHNGFITLANTANNPSDFSPAATDLASSTGTAFYTWFDFNDTEAGSGRIKTEEVGGILYVTWDGVEGYEPVGSTVSNKHTFQFQLDLNTGIVAYVWTNINSNSYAGKTMAVAYSDAGVSVAPTPASIAAAAPFTTQPDITLLPLTLSASPAPVITLGGAGPSVPITWTVNNVPDLAPPLGIGLSLALFSLAPLDPGVDMGFLGMPGCNLNILSLDVVVGMPGGAPTDSLTLAAQQPLFPGMSFYAQILSLFNPNTLPNGQNPFGGLLSNGVQSYFNTF